MKEYGYPLALAITKRTTWCHFAWPALHRSRPLYWPQPRFGEWSADHKDTLEAKLCRLVCDGRVPFAEAQREIATDWIAAYRKYIGRVSRKTAMQKVRSNP